MLNPFEKLLVDLADDDVEFITIMSGQRFADLLPFSATTTIQKRAVTHLTVEGLLHLKRDSLREKDRLDVLHLQQIKKDDEKR